MPTCVFILIVGIFDSISMHVAVVERDARSNLLQVVFGNFFIEEHVVHFLLQELGMSQFTSQNRRRW